MSNEGFVFRKAEDDTDRALVYRLRYQVYVEEWVYEDPADHPGGVEMDEHDAHSVHFMALRGGDLIGTIRLVRRSDEGLPLERHCPPLGDPIGPLGDQVAEISRLAVSKRFRRRKEDEPARAHELPPENDATTRQPGERRRGQEIVLGLFKAMYHESKHLGLTHWCAAMERALVLLLRRSRIVFTQIGPEIAYHGLRAPYLVEIARVDREWWEQSPELFREFVAELPADLTPNVEALLDDEVAV
jgi:N-acyl amino acid synthase of PEP-CTERM/exosortase system